jgi:hypothetical protein
VKPKAHFVCPSSYPCNPSIQVNIVNKDIDNQDSARLPTRVQRQIAFNLKHWISVPFLGVLRI